MKKTTTTTRTVDSGYFVRTKLIISPENGIEIVKDMESEPKLVWEPSHPDAIREGDMQGYVLYPNIDVVTERVDIVSTQRQYNVFSEYLREKHKIIILW